MKTAIIGSRSFDDYQLLAEKLNTFRKEIEITGIISGGAKGADSLGEKYARENNIKTHIFLPDWGKYGKAAGHRRNEEIIERADWIIIFWDRKSKGAKQAMDTAKLKKKRLRVFYYRD